MPARWVLARFCRLKSAFQLLGRNVGSSRAPLKQKNHRSDDRWFGWGGRKLLGELVECFLVGLEGFGLFADADDFHRLECVALGNFVHDILALDDVAEN